MRYIVFLLLITITGYSQTIDRNNIIARQKLQYSGGNPDSNKIAVSVDANGIFKWVYFTDLQDSVNTGIYDTTTANVVVTQAIRITGAAFASDTLVSIGTSGTVTKCFATCDTIQYILDNLGGGSYSPWDTLAGNVFLKDSTDNVGIGTDAPLTDLDVVGISFLRSDGYLSGDGCAIQKGDESTSIEVLQNGNLKGFIIVDTTGGVTINGLDSVLIESPKILLNPNTGNVGIGTVTPTEKLHVAGTSLFTDTLTYANGREANGYVLTSDASGNATWQAPITYNGDTLVSGVATAGSFTMPNNFGGLILSGTGTAVTYTLTLPDTPTEGQKILITNNDVAITLLSFAGNGNTLSATLSAGIGMTTSGQRWVTFHNGTWY
jgi:hypothetical protein